MEQKREHTALKIRTDVCIGCSHCIKVCPTEALRVTEGKASLHAEWCIDCGECFRVCPTRAIEVVDDDFQEIFKYRHRVLLVPGVFFAQFEESVLLEDIYNIFGNMGFSEVCTVEQSVDSLISEINTYIEKKEKPVISSFCPAVIRLIQVQFPSLVDKIMMLIPPLEITANYYKNKFKDKIKEEYDLGIFYLTPCIGKIASVKSPVGGYKSPINGVINMDYVYNKILLAFKHKSYSHSNIIINQAISAKGLLWPTTGGEAKYINGRTLAIDGMSNVIEFLERLEDEEITGVDFLELRGCDESCAGGILVQGNRFLIADYMRRISSLYPEGHTLNEEYSKFKPDIGMDAVQPRSMIKYDNDINVAIKKMEKARMLRELLPNIDCGACGAPSCEALAADIVREDLSLSRCIFLQRRFEKEGSLTLNESIETLEKIWGKERFINKNKINNEGK